MTESGQRYQNLMEQQRHNLAMERLGSRETAIKAVEAETNKRRADVAEREAAIKEKSAKVENAMRTVNTGMSILHTIYQHTPYAKIEAFGNNIIGGMSGSTSRAINASLFQ